MEEKRLFPLRAGRCLKGPSLVNGSDRRCSCTTLPTHHPRHSSALLPPFFFYRYFTLFFLSAFLSLFSFPLSFPPFLLGLELRLYEYTTKYECSREAGKPQRPPSCAFHGSRIWIRTHHPTSHTSSLYDYLLSTIILHYLLSTIY